MVHKYATDSPEQHSSSFEFRVFPSFTPVDMKVRLTAALDKRGFVCVWRAGQ